MKGYIDDNLELLDEESKKKVQEVINKYGSNKWWRSDDKVFIAKHQLFERTLMVESEKFLEGLDELLGRHVGLYEFKFNLNGLQDEARSAICRLKLGEPPEPNDINYRKQRDKCLHEAMDYFDSKGIAFVSTSENCTSINNPDQLDPESRELSTKLKTALKKKEFLKYVKN